MTGERQAATSPRQQTGGRSRARRSGDVASRLAAVDLGTVAAGLDGQRVDAGLAADRAPSGDLVVGFERLERPPAGADASRLRLVVGADGRITCQVDPAPATSPATPSPRGSGSGSWGATADGVGTAGSGTPEGGDEVDDWSAGCDLVYRAAGPDIVAALLQIPLDLEGPGRFTVDDRGRGGRWCGPLPPLDMAVVPAFAELPAVPGATVQTQMVLTGSPVGLVAYVLRIEDGRLVGCELGEDINSDVFVQFRYADYLEVRTGALTVAEALRHGALDGSFGKAQTLSGLIRSPAFEAAYAQGCGATARIARHARVVDHPSYRRVTAQIRWSLGLDRQAAQP